MLARSFDSSSLSMMPINKIAPDIGLKDIIWGTLPFVGLMMVGIAILCFVPEIATALTNAVYNK